MTTIRKAAKTLLASHPPNPLTRVNRVVFLDEGVGVVLSNERLFWKTRGIYVEEIRFLLQK